jgi:hypothetical protein
MLRKPVMQRYELAAIGQQPQNSCGLQVVYGMNTEVCRNVVTVASLYEVLAPIGQPAKGTMSCYIPGIQDWATTTYILPPQFVVANGTTTNVQDVRAFSL